MQKVPFDEAVQVWIRVAAASFGGPAGQIAVMHRIVVDEKKWVSEARFLHALNFCMLLPGPEAQQLATYLGWLLHGTRGGLVAGGLFILPGFVSILALSLIYATWQQAPVVEGRFVGLKAAVLAVVFEAVLRIGGRVLKNPVMLGVAAASFVGIHVFAVPFPLIIVGAGLLGVLGHQLAPGAFAVLTLADAEDEGPATARPPWAATARTAATWLGIWLIPVGALALLLGPDHVYTELAVFFSGASTVTFGGAYAVLAYVGQQAVEVFGWLEPGEMLDGLGLAEATPGPLIQVVQFVGFMATWRHPGTLPPWVSGTVGAVITTWVTFAPCFLWIFAGAPYIEWLRGNRLLTAALSTVTAAVVGVIANLAVWFALHTLFGAVQPWEGPVGASLLVPVWGTIDLVAVAVAVTAAVALLRFHVRLLFVLGGAGLFGMFWRLVVL